MGSFWVKNGSGVWVQNGSPWVKTGSGYVQGKFGHIKTDATTWTQFYSRDTTPPAAPTMTAAIKDGTKNVLVITMNQPAERIRRSVVKVAKAPNWPSTATSTTDGYYYSEIGNYNTGPEEWSEWWKPWDGTNPSLNPDHAGYAYDFTGSRDFPHSFHNQTFTLDYDTTYNISGWCQDDFYNWSSAGTVSIRTLKADPPPPTRTNHEAYFYPDSSSSFMSYGWRGDNNYVYQGGEHNGQGFWFYGDKIRNALSKASSIRWMNIYIQRVNSSHGVPGEANVRLGVHHSGTRPSSAPTIYGIEKVGALGRGGGKWLGVPSVHWNHFSTNLNPSAGNRGFALSVPGTTAYTSPDYMYAYGAGTESGRVHIGWTEN